MRGPVGPQKAGSDWLFEGSLAKNGLKIRVVTSTAWWGGPWGGPMWVAALGTPRRALGGTRVCWGVPHRVCGAPKPPGDPPVAPLAPHSPRAQRPAAILFTGGCHGDEGPLRLAQR